MFYGHQPISVIESLSLRRLRYYAGMVERFVQHENESRAGRLL